MTDAYSGADPILQDGVVPRSTRVLSRISGVAAIVIGVMGVGVGSATLLGLKDAGYVTHDWLIAYNVLLGIVSVLVGVAILRRFRGAAKAALAIAVLHIGTLGIVLVLWSLSTAAVESVGAMVFRSVAWLAIWLFSSRGIARPG